jgi:hypothetical protein
MQGTLVTLAVLAIQPTNGAYWKIKCARPEGIEIEIAKRHRGEKHRRA